MIRLSKTIYYDISKYGYKRYRSVAVQIDVYNKILELSKKEERSLTLL